MLQQFYEDVLPDEGYYALFLSGAKRHVWADSVEELVRQTEKRIDDHGVYFATAAFEVPVDRTAANVLSRTSICFDIDAGAAKFAKHGDKVYPTQREALAAVVQWTKATRIAPSYILSSGDGLHVYYLLDTPLVPEAWRPLALAVKAAALDSGLRIDPSVTGDAARILRPPGTLHHTGARVSILHASKVRYAPETLRAMLPESAVRSAQPQVQKPRSRNAELLEAPVGPPRTVAKVLDRCPAMRAAADAGGNVPEPYWRAMLGVLKFTVEGADAAHQYSQGHPSYDYDQTQAKFDRWTAGPTTCATFEAEAPEACRTCAFRGKVKSPIMLGEMTPPEVEAFQEAQPPAEAPAPDESEDALVSMAEVAPAKKLEPWDKYLPEGYRVVPTKNGHMLVAKRVVPRVNAAGETTNVEIDVNFTSVAFWIESWAPGYSDDDQAITNFAVYDTSRHTTTRYTLPTRVVAKQDTLLTALASQNVQAYPSTNLAKATLMEFVKDSLELIRAAGQRQKVVDRFGTMYNNKGELVVAQGKHVITRTGEIVEGVVAENLRYRANAYTINLPDPTAGRWGADVLKAHVYPRAQQHIAYLNEFYSDDNFLPYQLAIMLAWASPLMAFVQGTFPAGAPLPAQGLTVSLYSTRSGIGKTAAMHAAALAFGIPTGIVLQLDRTNSTDNARHALVAQSGTLPSFMDEMENVEPRDLAALVSSVGNGATKQRMTKDLGLVGGKPLALINVMSTNKSHRELVAVDRNESSAVQMRLLEIDCTGVQEVSPERARQETEARSKVLECAGAVGAILHWGMCTIGGEKLNEQGIYYADVARTHLQGKQDGRFMWRTLGAMLSMRAILAKLGLVLFDEAKLIAEFRRWHDVGYEFARENLMPQDAQSRISMMLSDLAGDTLITKTESHRAGGHDKAMDIPLNDRMPNNVVARSVLDGRYVYVKTDAIKEWCQERRISHVVLLAQARDTGVLEPPDTSQPRKVGRQIDLFKGTKLAQGVRSTVVKVLLDRLGAEGAGSYENVIDMHRAQAPAQTNVKEARQ